MVTETHRFHALRSALPKPIEVVFGDLRTCFRQGGDRSTRSPWVEVSQHMFPRLKTSQRARKPPV